MMTFLEWLAFFSQWILLTSVKATVVIALILLIRGVFRSKLPPKWLHALWFLLMVRLLFPFELPNSMSIFNWTDEITYKTLPPRPIYLDFPMKGAAFQTPLSEEMEAPSTNPVNQSPEPETLLRISLLELAGLVWLVGCLGWLGFILIFNYRHRFRFQNIRKCEDDRLKTVLEQCKQRLGITKEIGIYLVDGIQSPFCDGMLKPRILIPAHVWHSFTNEQLAHIFLHELAHYKRKDIPVAWLTLMLQIVHWFNPLVWYSFFIMRGDREMACDELVLNHIGTAQSQPYGQTLIALLRHAKQAKFLPATLGLADSRLNLKRRIQMISNFSLRSKWWAFFTAALLLTLSLVALTSSKKQAAISGNITVQSGNPPETIYIGLYDYNWNDSFFANAGEPISFLELTHKNHYSFKVDPGMYTLVVWALNFDNAQFKIFVEKTSSDQDIDISLAPKGLPEKISHVAFIGDYCGWDQSKAAQMKNIDGIWRVDKPDELKVGQKYKFFVWENEIIGFQEFLLDPSNKPVFRYSPGSKNMQVSRNWGTFDHIYNGEEIVFNPALFVQPRQKAIIHNKDWELAEQFNRLPEELYLFELESVRPLNDKGQSLNQKEHFAKMYDKLGKIQQTYDPYLEPFFIEPKLRLFELFSPIRYDYTRNIAQKDIDSSMIKDFFTSENFKKHFSELVSLAKKLDSKSWFYYAGVIAYNLFHQIPMFLEKWPPLQNEYGISKQYCFDKLEDFALNAVNPGCQEAVIFELMNRNACNDSTALAQKYENMLREKFPNGWAWKAIEEEKNRFTWEPVQPYPAKNFKVITLTGEAIELAQLKGKFVFIDFWGSWCSPCRKELPNLVKMAETLPSEKFQLIGLAKDEEKTLKEYLHKKPLPYPNAIADKSLLEEWEIKSFPTSFLINPKGEVIAKNFRGSRTAQKVGELIEQYFKIEN